MALNFLLKRSGTASKRPDPASMSLGEIDLNYDASTGGVYYKDSAGNAVKVGPCQVSTTAPNSSPAGSTGNSAGEFWYDTSTSILYVWDGSAWADSAATAVADSSFTASGELLAGTGAGTYSALSVGTDGQILFADSSCATGIKWGDNLIGFTTATNTALGTNAGDSITTGINNVVIGLNSGTNITSGSNNVILGANTGDNITTGVSNTFVGATAGGNLATGSEGNTAIGFGAGGIGPLSGGYNTILGHSAGQAITSGGGNTFVGFQTGSSVTTGIHNTFLGRYLGTGAMSNNVVLADGAGTVRFQANSSGAWSPNGTSYGTAGQFLQSQGTSGVPVWASLPAASTSAAGIVQLEDSVTSTSTTLALTANQGKLLQDQISALATGNNLTFAGTIDASTGLVTTVSTEGSAAGFTVGQALPAAATGNAEYFVIVSTPGTFTPPGGVATTANDGDWFISDGTTTYTYIPAGWTPINASETEAGLVELATDAEVQAGTDTTRAVTPAGLQSKLSDSTSTTSSTTIASSTAVKSAYDLADAAIPDNTFTAIGEVIVGTAAGTYTVLAPGTAGQFLQSNGAGQQLTWEDVPASPISSYTANHALVATTPLNLLEWDTGVRMGTLVIMATDNSTNHAWANVTIGADTGVGTSAVTTQSTGVGTFAVIAGGSGETVIEFTPSTTLASVDFVFQYTAAFGGQPTIL